MRSDMKPKQQRLHHARKRLQREDPLRLCHGVVGAAGYHSFGTVIHVVDHFDGTFHIKSQCTICNKEIDGVADLKAGETLDYPTLRDLEWRTHRYIIQEDPF